jgi:hypothetical protein
MLKNYFKTAWRNLIKNKGYSSINIIGLATGMAVALLIGLWIWDELSFDKYYKNHDRLAQLMTTQTFNDQVGTGPAVSVAMGLELRNNHKDDFKYVCLSSWNFDHLLAVGEKKNIKIGFVGTTRVSGNANAENAGRYKRWIERSVFDFTYPLAGQITFWGSKSNESGSAPG